MTRDVIMPALGMAQEAGVIVTWLKRPGEAVKAGEALFEVETDKTVMVVEADAEGVLTDLRHGEGAEVPVGEVIARIAPADGAATAPPSTAKPVEPVAPLPVGVAPESIPSADRTAAPEVLTMEARPAPADERVLASPKARRLARERGIDLRALVRAGLPQPLHAADLDRAPAAMHAPIPALNRVAARAEAKAFLAFRTLLAEEAAAPSDGVLWAAFAAGSLREALSAGGEALVVAVERPGAAGAAYRDPDLGPLAEVREADGLAAPAISLRDLTGRRLTEVALARDAGPCLCIAGGEGAYAVSLTWPGASLSEEQAVALVEAFAARIEQPLRHLL